MHLESKLQVTFTHEQVTKFFYEPSSLAKWDKSVAEMIPGDRSKGQVGSSFETISPSGMRMYYEIIEFDKKDSVKIKLLHSRMFKKAIWHFQFIPISQGTEIRCGVDFSLRLPYLFLYPVLYFNTKALLRDLKFLEIALEKNYSYENT